MRAARGFVLVLGLAAIAVACQHRVVRVDNSMPGDWGVFLFAFELSSCPDPNYFPPREIRLATGSAEAGYLEGPYCHGFTKYWERLEHTRLSHRDTGPLYVRLQQPNGDGKKCAVFVGVPTARMCVGLTLKQCQPYQVAREQAWRLLEILFDSTSLRPLARTENMTGFPTHDDFRQWCADRIRDKVQSTSHPVFQESAPLPRYPQNAD